MSQRGVAIAITILLTINALAATAVVLLAYSFFLMGVASRLWPYLLLAVLDLPPLAGVWYARTWVSRASVSNRKRIVVALLLVVATVMFFNPFTQFWGFYYSADVLINAGIVPARGLIDPF